MPDARVTKLIRELQNGADISGALKEIWAAKGPDAVSLGDSVKLAKTICTTADGMRSLPSLRAYYLAAMKLRTFNFAKTESEDLMANVSSVERFCLNYMMKACEVELLDATLATTASKVAESALRRLFQARNAAHIDVPKQKSTSRSRSTKENRDPQKNLEHDDIVNDLFDGACELVKDDYMPRNESIISACVVFGCIATRVIARNDGLSLKSRVQLAANYAVPWSKYIEQITEKNDKYRTVRDAHITKMKNGLVTAAQMPDCNVVEAVEARAFACRINRPTLIAYSYEMLRAINSFFRRRKKGSLSEVQEHRVVSELYSKSMSMLGNSRISVNDWLHEDVSTLLDSIISVEARSSVIGVSGNGMLSKDALNRVMKARSEALAEAKVQGEKFVHDFQKELYSGQAYELLAMEDITSTFRVMNSAMKATFPRMLLNIDTTYNSITLFSKSKKTLNAKTALRLLRVLEPFRAQLCAKRKALTDDQQSFLQVYVCVNVMGRLNPCCKSLRERKERLTEGEMLSRIVDMAAGCLESTERLLMTYLKNCDEKRVSSTLQQIDGFLSQKSMKGGPWSVFMVRRLNNFGITTIDRERDLNKPNKELLKSLGEALDQSTQWLDHSRLCPDVGGYFEKHEHIPDFLNSVVMAVQCFRLVDDFNRALTITAEKMVRTFTCESSVLQHGIMNRKLRESYLKTCGQIFSLAQDKEQIPKFIELISLGKPLDGHTRNALGRNIVHALSEYAVQLRRMNKTESISISNLERSMVKARFEFLEELNLTGKCMALQVQKEWTQLLLEGISIGKDDLNTSVQKKGNLLSLADITADTPRGGWTSDVITFNDGESLQVELTPRTCRCSICSSDGFALLHILRDSWRLSVQRNPPLIREHLGRLDRFLTSCDTSQLHPILTILSLDFTEWCQVFSILSSIEDRTGSLTRMISKLMKELELPVSDNVGSIYASHGFVAARSYYSRLIDQENRSDFRATFFEKEQFMYYGCKSDVYMHNLELTKAREAASTSVRLVLERLTQRVDAASKAKTLYHVSGREVWIHGEIISKLDKIRALETLELIFALERMGVADMKTENYHGAKYFLMKSAGVSSHLCGDESLLHLRQKAVMHKINAVIGDGYSDAETFLLAGSNEMAVRNEGQFDKTLVSNTYAEAADIALTALSASVPSDEKARELGELAAKFSGIAMDVLFAPSDKHMLESNEDEQEVTSMINMDISMRSGEALMRLGKSSRAATLFEKLREEAKGTRLDVYLGALLGLCSSLIAKVGGSEKVQSLLKKRRRGRKSKDLVVSESAVAILEEAEEILRESQWEPHRRMEFFVLYESVLGESDASLKLAWEIGGGFTFNWMIQKNKMLALKGSSNSKEQDEDDLIEMVKGIHISPTEPNLDHHMNELCGLVAERSLVVVSMTFDASNGRLMLWRCGADGYFSVRLPVELDGDVSMRGVTRRFSDVFARVKRNAATYSRKYTDDESSNWWKTTFEIDEDLGVILSDIEEHWFDDARVLLLPSFDNMSKAELNKVLSKLDVTGDVSTIGSNTNPNAHVVLVLDPQLEPIPFESLPCVRTNLIGVSRAPSLTYLLHQLRKRPAAPNPRNVYYLVNPDGDLKKTEDMFKKAFKAQPGWNGHTGVLESSKSGTLTAKASKADILLYCGHGGGEKHVSASGIARGDNPTPLAVLMGCSSARLEPHGGHRWSTGTPLDYLIHGAPAVVGNLWDVTDKDIDRLTVAFLKNWLGVLSSDKIETKSMAVSLAQARSVTRMKYLTGAATVIYGLPFL